MTMQFAQVVFTVDPVVKSQAMLRAKREGVPFASVLKLATKAYAEGHIAINIASEECFNAKTAREIRAALSDIKKGKNLISFESNEAMDDYLLSI